MAASALSVRASTDWMSANLAGPIFWPRLLQALGRAAAHFAEFQV
jgi:hypothetical protein